MVRSHRAAQALDVVSLEAGGVGRHWLSARTDGLDPLEVFAAVPPAEGHVALQLVFGGTRYHSQARALMHPVTWPITWLQGDTCSGEHLAGTQVLAISGAQVEPLRLGDEVVGCAYEDEDARYAWLGGVLPPDLSRDRPAQAQAVFERLEAGLAQAGMGFSDTVRTWLFLDHLLDWYAEFNSVRTRFFVDRGVFNGTIPASTGIGAANPAGAALVAGLYALQPKRAGVQVVPVTSPLQCPATSYRSSFSRAVEVRHTGWRNLIVSGTASVGPQGNSAYQGDIDQQIALTMDVVRAILDSCGMGWGDVFRGVAYFEDIRQLPRFDAYLRQLGLPRLPVVPAHAVVCRPDLLFELEVDAAAAG